MATLDDLAALGALDGANSIGNMDQLDNVTIHEASGTAAVSASATAAEPIKFIGFSAIAATSATATADVGRTKGMAATAASAGTVSASAFLIRLVNGQPTANVSATASSTLIRQLGSIQPVNFTVTVANVNGSNVFVIDGVNNPALTLDQGGIYVFDVSDSSLSGHPLAFKNNAAGTLVDQEYETGVSASGIAGTAGAKVHFNVPTNAPASLRYFCTVHGNGMGNTISVSSATISPPLATASGNQPTPNFLFNIDGSAATSVGVAGQSNGVFSFVGAGGITTSASANATPKILGEAWTVQPDAAGAWFIQ